MNRQNGNGAAIDTESSVAAALVATNGDGVVAQESVASRVITAVARIEASGERPKLYVLDTNVLIHDPEAIEKFQENGVIIPVIVLRELNKLKKNESTMYEARQALRLLEEYRQENGNLTKKAPTKGGGFLSVDMSRVDRTELPDGFDLSPDSIILLMTKRLQKANPESQVILVTKDLPMRLEADAMGITVEDYKSDKTVAVEQLYDGAIEIPVPAEFVDRLYSKKNGGPMTVDDANGFLETHFRERLKPNMCCLLKGNALEKKYGLAIWKDEEQVFVPVLKSDKRGKRNEKYLTIYPRNDRQCLAYELVMDPTIPLVTLAGKAGTGKTLMALLAARQLLEHTTYDRLVIIRPMVGAGEEMGFMPGDVAEKFAPWAEPAMECLRLAYRGDEKTLNVLLKSEKIVCRPVTHERGRTYPGSLVIVDEVQNMAPNTVKMLVTRPGEGTKMVFIGDYHQIDNPLLDPQSNGLARMIHRMSGRRLTAHLRLIQGERSPLAELAANVL